MAETRKKILSVDLENAKEKVAELSKKAGDSAKGKVAEVGKAALGGIASGSKLGFRKLIDVSINLSEKQVLAIKRLKAKLN